MRRVSKPIALALSLGIVLLLQSGCSQDGRLPPPDDRSPVTVETPKVNVRPSARPYQIDRAFIDQTDDLAALPEQHKRLLAQNGFLISTCPEREMYELYCSTPSPFITTDCAFHAYHVLLADTLSNIEEAVLAARLDLMVASAHKAASRFNASLPVKLKAAERALVFWAIAHRLMDPDAFLDPGIHDEVTSEVDRMAEGSFVGTPAGDDRKPDYTVYTPIADYGRTEKMQRYFRCKQYLSLTPIAFQTEEQAQTCALVVMALCSKRKAWKAYQDFDELSRFLSGESDDVAPHDVLAVLRSVIGEMVAPEKLADEATTDKLRTLLAELKPQTIADQPQDSPGADPRAGRGMRVLPRGVSIRAKAFQRLGEGLIQPSGKHILYLLGNEAVPLEDSQKRVLAVAKESVSQAALDYEKGLDVHTSSLVALSKLSGDRTKGYPQFMGTRPWALKTANMQLGAWSQVEHDVFLYAKDTAYYLCGGRNELFYGYVEPEPEYYAALAALVARTRIVFDRLSAFRNIKTLAVSDSRERPDDRHATVATAAHFRTLEEILLKLKTLSEKELLNQDFDGSDAKFMLEFGKKLKWLAFNESNSSHAHEPMSGIVRIAREYSKEEGFYVGTGRPLQILVIVPWQGKLRLCTGAVYSYYEFMQPLSAPVADPDWKRQTLTTVASQKHRPWFVQHDDLGLAPRILSGEELAKWLPKQKNHFYAGFGSYLLQDIAPGPPDSLGFVELDGSAIDVAAKAFAERQDDDDTRRVLYAFLAAAPNDIRKKAALQALSIVIAEIDGGAYADSPDNISFIHLSLRLLKDEAADASVRNVIIDLAKRDRGNHVLKECREDPDVRALLEKVGIESQ